MTDKKSKKVVVAKEVAEAEFERFADIMDLDIDPAGMDEEDKTGLEQNKKRIISAIQKGALVVNDKGEPVFTPQRTQGLEDITFHEPTGASLMAMDRKKKNHDISKMFATMADMTGGHSNSFSKMKMSDLKVCLAVTTLFLG